MNAKQLRWLAEELGEDNVKGAELRERYADDLQKKDFEPVYLRWDDHERLTRFLTMLRCPFEQKPCIRLPWQQGQAGASRTPVPKTSKVSIATNGYAKHQATSHPPTRSLGPKVSGGDYFEPARIRTLQHRPEGRGLGMAECSWVARAYEFDEEKLRAARLEEASRFPDVLQLCNNTELSSLREWAAKEPDIWRKNTDLDSQELETIEDRATVAVSENVVSFFFDLLEKYSHDQARKSIKLLGTSFARDPGGEAVRAQVTATTLPHIQAILIPVCHEGGCGLVVVEPHTKQLLSIRSNNGSGVEELGEVRKWIAKLSGSSDDWRDEIRESFESSTQGAGLVLACYNAAKYVYNPRDFGRRSASDKELRAIRSWVLYNVMRGEVTTDRLRRLEQTKQ